MADENLSGLIASRKILIVDDEKFSRSITTRSVNDITGGTETVIARDGAEGLHCLVGRSREYAAAICDFNMPVMNGLQFLKQVRSGLEGMRNDLPVIMLTGHSDSALVGAALKLDVDGFVVKPASLQALQTRLRHALAAPHGVHAPKHYAPIDVDAISKYLLENKPKQPAGATSQPRGARTALDEIAPPVTLASDITAHSGELLLSAGMVLTPRLLERLRELAGMKIIEEHVWLE
ncbi:MAG: response regulator [Magnetospirillum sp.]|nr:response regulator [Magnetospirillum sp.]